MFTITPMKIGECFCPGELACFLNDWDKKVLFYYYFWLIQGRGKNILIDTGYDLACAHKFMPDMKQKLHEHPLKRLKEHDLTPGDIDYVIITHSHFDHLSPMIHLYKNAKIVIQQKELEVATNPVHPWFSQFCVREAARSLKTKYRHRTILVDGDKTILPGLKVLHTGGHTPGHQSILINTKLGNVVLSGDVILTYKNLHEDIPIGIATSIEECLLAMRKIRKLTKIIFAGHDPKALQAAKSFQQKCARL